MTGNPSFFSVSSIRWGWLGVSTCLYILLGYSTTRSQFGILIGLYALLVWGYSLRVRAVLAQPDQPQDPDRFLFGAALLFRLTLLLAMPALSDDYARFVWDGRLLIQGVNPFRYLPVEWMAGGIQPSIPIDPALYQLLNSPAYYTVYPPVSQAFFALAAWLSPTGVLGSVVILRSIILLAEVATLWLMVKVLRAKGRNQNLALLYGLNPLVILELTGNIHFEGVMICLTLLATYLWQQKKLLASAGMLALAIGTKLLPLLVLPVVVAQLGWQRGLRYSAIVLVGTTLLFLPFFDLDLLLNMLESIDLYFRKFEFNASLYYLIRQIGYLLVNYNVLSKVGLWLSMLTALGMLSISFLKTYPAQVRILWVLTLYFVMATTIHPWYITTLVAIAVFATSRPYQLRYVLVWSALVWLSYSAYQTLPVVENTALLLVEYGAVFGLFIVETRRYLKNHTSHAQTIVEV